MANIMKYTFLTTILILLSTQIFAQNFTISELIKINKYQLDNFDTYVTQKGYKYFDNSKTDFSEETNYVFYSNNVKTAFITKFYYKTQTKEMVSFQTNNNSTYLKIKSELKILGFKFINTETNRGTTFFNYKKGNIQVSLASSVQVNTYGYELNTYEISVW